MKYFRLPLLPKFLIPSEKTLFHYHSNMTVLSIVFHIYNLYKIKNHFPPHLIHLKLMKNTFHRFQDTSDGPTGTEQTPTTRGRSIVLYSKGSTFSTATFWGLHRPCSCRKLYTQFNISYPFSYPRLAPILTPPTFATYGVGLII